MVSLCWLINTVRIVVIILSGRQCHNSLALYLSRPVRRSHDVTQKAIINTCSWIFIILYTHLPSPQPKLQIHFVQIDNNTLTPTKQSSARYNESVDTRRS